MDPLVYYVLECPTAADNTTRQGRLGTCNPPSKLEVTEVPIYSYLSTYTYLPAYLPAYLLRGYVCSLLRKKKNSLFALVPMVYHPLH